VLIAGKPSGETMAITRVDDHHLSTIVKLNGKAFGTSKATLSPDGKVLTVVNDVSSSAGGQQVGKTTEIWVRQ
jgi:predicted SpoU family rRNA methylase